MSSPMFIFTPLTILRPKRQYYHQCFSEPLEFVALIILTVKVKRFMTLQLISNTPRISLIVPWLEQEKSIIYNVTENNFSSKNLLVLPYHDNFANIPQVLKTSNVNVCFKNNFTVNNKLIKNSPQCNEGSIYTVSCKNCNRFYIEQTGKTLEQGKKQHKYSVRTGQQSNHYLYK